MASAPLTKLLTGLATQIKPSGIATQAAKKTAPQIKKSDTILDADFEAPINTRKIKADYNRTIKEQVKRKDLLDNPNKLKKYAKDKGISTNQMLNLIQNNYKNNIEVEKNLKKLISDDSFKEAEKNLKARSKKIKFKDVEKKKDKLKIGYNLVDDKDGTTRIVLYDGANINVKGTIDEFWGS